MPHLSVEEVGGTPEGLLNRLMNRAGELILAQNKVLSFNETQHDPNGTRAGEERPVARGLRLDIGQSSTQPWGALWNEVRRLVRDLEMECGKRVAVEMEGKETEFERATLDALLEPLTQLIRNAVHHGIEPRLLREAAGKPDAGRVLLRAYAEGAWIVVEVSDDGAGVDTERVVRLAVERSLVSAEDAEQLSAQARMALLFSPGVSLAHRRGDVSYRGDGLAAVKRDIERLGGSVRMKSEAGKGATVLLRVATHPVQAPVLVVSNAGERFAIPQSNLLETFSLTLSEAAGKIHAVAGAPKFLLRGELLPFIVLRDEVVSSTVEHSAIDAALRRGRPSMAPVTPPPYLRALALRAARATFSVVIVHADEMDFALGVDRIHGVRDALVDPLPMLTQGSGIFAGCATFSDSASALMLYPNGIAERIEIGLAPAAASAWRSSNEASTGTGPWAQQTAMCVGAAWGEGSASDCG